MALVPARLAFDADGTPFSEAFGDVYHSRDGGLEQARAVFLTGNGLPGRWRGRERFVVVETGFGLGLNFLATWAAWRADPARCDKLHFVSAELHPFVRADLARLHVRWPDLAPLADELQRQWPALVRGMHRLEFDGGRIVLTLMFGDARQLLRELECRADAFYLDGFSPARNPELWSEAVFAQIGRLAAPAATAATWSVAGAVRRGLEAVGFHCGKAAGFGGKRERCVARFAGALSPSTALARHAIVVGAGLAGTSVAERLAARGWTIDLVDAAGSPGCGASGNLAGVLRPLPSLDDNRLARITRAGALYGSSHLERLTALGLPVRWNACGVLHLARDPVHEGKQHAVVEAQRPPADYLCFVDRDEASAIAGWPLPLGGWWFPRGAWVQPPSLCRANVVAWPDRIRAHFGRAMDELRRGGEGWQVLDARAEPIATAPIVILANGAAITKVAAATSLPVRSARGQVSHLAAECGSAPRVVVCRLGYVTPEIDGQRCAGATFTVDDDEPELRASDHRENLAKLDFILPGYAAPFGSSDLAGRVGFRPASPDRLPMIGAVPVAGPVDRATPLAEIPRLPGLYAVTGFGARGLVWAALAGELLASALEGEPLPLERELAGALDPARFLLKPGRRIVTET